MVDKETYSADKVPKEWKVLFGGLAGLVIIILHPGSIADPPCRRPATYTSKDERILATSVAHPFDLLKVRLQLSKLNTFGMAREIVQREGVRGLYAGLSAGLLRQATYTTTRLGVYNWLYDSYKMQYNENPPLARKVMMGIYSGVAGAFVGTPSEVVLVRMMTEGKEYHGLFQSIVKIVKKEGFMTLWRGGVPTISRSIFVSTAQLGTYTQAREIILQHRKTDDFYLHFYTSLIASLTTAIASLPADNIKTRAQFVGEKLGQFGIFKDTIKNEGFFALWRGFPPYYTRLALHTVLTFVIMEQMNSLYFNYNAP